ncbi:hypothetical protein QP735_04285 [Curtobacterium citreum]|uniref:hypothetical protein n=1 Tax=Curtobacterium citreum TaxID=2036 RepID=UPI00254F3C76|nr:hypothetical protein [Curtobacterium citreum]MDK8171742.1 hypothetical protein [Curtobacterium citreum]
MTPLEELQAAHKRLSELQQTSEVFEGGTWMSSSYDDRSGTSILGSELGGQLAYGEEEVRYDTPTADLIVTLHRTIDAQLKLLAEAASLEGSRADWGGPFASGVWRSMHALLLARAINGGTDDAA